MPRCKSRFAVFTPAEQVRLALLAPIRKDVFLAIQPSASARYPSLLAQVVRVHTGGPNVLVRCRFGYDERGRSVLRWVPIGDLLLPSPVSRAA